MGHRSGLLEQRGRACNPGPSAAAMQQPSSSVMAGLVPAIHVLPRHPKTWMPGTRPGMTQEKPSPELERDKLEGVALALDMPGVEMTADHQHRPVGKAREQRSSGFGR